MYTRLGAVSSLTCRVFIDHERASFLCRNKVSAATSESTFMVCPSTRTWRLVWRCRRAGSTRSRQGMLRSAWASMSMNVFFSSSGRTPYFSELGPGAGDTGVLCACIVCASSTSILFYVRETGPGAFYGRACF